MVKDASVLVVDDERPNIEILERSLARAGHRATGAESAEGALAALAAGHFDMVLLDHVLPGATGMQSLGALRKLTKAPIYLMSGCTHDDMRKDAFLLGAAGFLPKPLDFAAILALLAALPER